MTKTVFITGSSSGIGEQTAYLFAAQGDNLIITYHQDKQVGERVATECLRLGAKQVLLLPLELQSDESISQSVEKIVKQFKQVDILINNAATLKHGLLLEQSFTDIEKQIRTNLEGLIKLTRQCLPYLKESLINVSSNLGLKGHKGLATYSATKFAVRGFSQSLAKELPNLLIYSVNPSLTATKMGSPSGVDPKKVAKIIFQAARGCYQAPSGSDINVRDYLYGEKMVKTVKTAKLIKRILKKLLRF